MDLQIYQPNRTYFETFTEAFPHEAFLFSVWAEEEGRAAFTALGAALILLVLASRFLAFWGDLLLYRSLILFLLVLSWSLFLASGGWALDALSRLIEFLGGAGLPVLGSFSRHAWWTAQWLLGAVWVYLKTTFTWIFSFSWWSLKSAPAGYHWFLTRLAIVVDLGWGIILVVLPGLLVGLLFLGLPFLIALYIKIKTFNTDAEVQRRITRRRGTRGRGRVINRRRIRFDVTSLQDEAIRLMTFTERDLGTIRDVERRLQEIARREPVLVNDGLVVQPDDLTAVSINEMVRSAMMGALYSEEQEAAAVMLEINWMDIWLQHYVSQGMVAGTWTTMRLEWEYRLRVYLGLDLPLPRN